MARPLRPPTLDQRASGVLLHPTSLPGPFAIGDLGPAALRFLDFLEDAGQSWWQFLPLGPEGKGDSPYSSPSAFAGSPLLLSPERLADEGLLDRSDLAFARTAPSTRVDFGGARRAKGQLLRRAFAAFSAGGDRARARLDAFAEANRAWLDDFALYQALARAEGPEWSRWPAALARRDPPALARARERLAREIDLVRWVQLEFTRQWQALRDGAARRGIGLLGDVPIYVAHKSADVWAHQEVFALDRQGRPRHMAGVPPDYFSRTGQLWENPVYRWDVLRARGYDWWIERMRRTFALCDAVRLDHFIGFVRYWEVRAPARTARKGRFRPGPAGELFERLGAALGPLAIVAEDLGLLTPEVAALRDGQRFPGMHVLQFAFGGDDDGDGDRPWQWGERAVVYTGTHDNDTTAGWWQGLGRRERDRVRRYLASPGGAIHRDLIRLGWMLPCRLAMVPAQDLLGLGRAARMNTPATRSGNWAWRLREGALDAPLARWLRDLTSTYGRLGRRLDSRPATR